MLERNYFVYILTNKNNKVLYTGVTNNLANRIYQHKTKINHNSFTVKYKTTKLVYYETFNDIGTALFREKQIKAGSRSKKIALISSINNEWKDLFNDLA